MDMKLPVISGAKLAKYLIKEKGWEFYRQRGSHIILIKKGLVDTLTVPKHNPIKKGTLVGILKEAGISREEFILAMQ